MSPSKNKPPNAKRAFEKHKPRHLFSEICGTFKISSCDFIKRNSEQEELHYVKKVIWVIFFLLLPYKLLFIFMGMRAPDWAMNIIRTLEKKKYMWLDIVIYWVIPEKILTPPTEGTVFWHPPPHT